MSLLENLDQETLKKIVTNAVAAGVIDRTTLDPVNTQHQSYEMIVGEHGAFEIPPECDRVQYLSEGGYGVVTRCRALNPARYGGFTQVAVKKVSLPHEKAFDSEWEDNIRLLREIHFMRHLPHPNITPIVHIYMNREAKVDLAKLKCFYIVMPLYSPGSIDIIGVVSEEKKFCGIMRDVTSGLLWMHKHKVLHRDIKRENIFYDEENNNAVIADLGMARSTKKKMTGGRECSTKSYLAPELIMETSETYSYPVDIWALGCVFYEMLIFADEGGAMFAESNPYHLILARQYSINKAFGTKLGRKRIKYGTHNIQQLATQEGVWVKNRWINLEKQMNRFVKDEKWDPSMESFIPDVIKKCLQFYPNDRCTAQELAELLKKSHVCKVAGDINMPKKKIKQRAVTENFQEQAEKLKTDKQRGDMIRKELWRLVQESHTWENGNGNGASSSTPASSTEAGKTSSARGKKDSAKDLLAKDMARERELEVSNSSGSSSAAVGAKNPMLLTDDGVQHASSSGRNTPTGTAKAKVASGPPRAKVVTSMRKPSAAAKRRNTRKALAMPTIDEEGGVEGSLSDNINASIQKTSSKKMNIGSMEKATSYGKSPRLKAQPAAGSPKKGPLSPKRGAVSPKKTPASPKRTPASPKKTPASPKRGAASPKKTPGSSSSAFLAPTPSTCNGHVPSPRLQATKSRPEPVARPRSSRKSTRKDAEDSGDEQSKKKRKVV